MEQELLAGGAATATGLYVGRYVIGNLYTITTKWLNRMVGELSVFGGRGATVYVGGSVPELPALATFALVAYDPANEGGVMLVAPNGVFYFTMPDLHAYRFCQWRPDEHSGADPNEPDTYRLAMQKNPFFLMCTARELGGDEDLLHNLVDNTSQHTIRRRFTAFVSDCALHMLLNDLILVLLKSPPSGGGLQSSSPLLNRIKRLFETDLSNPIPKDGGSLMGLFKKIASVLWNTNDQNAPPSIDPPSAYLLSDFFLNDQPESLDLRDLCDTIKAAASAHNNTFLWPDMDDKPQSEADDKIDEHAGATLGVELFLPWWTSLPMRVFVLPHAQPLTTENASPEFLQNFTKDIGRLRYRLILPAAAGSPSVDSRSSGSGNLSGGKGGGR